MAKSATQQSLQVCSSALIVSTTEATQALTPKQHDTLHATDKQTDTSCSLVDRQPRNMASSCQVLSTVNTITIAQYTVY